MLSAPQRGEPDRSKVGQGRLHNGLRDQGVHAAVGDITEFPIPIASDGNFPLAITAGPDGNLWVTEGAGGLGSTTTDKLAKVTTSGVFTQYPFPAIHSEPVSIANGPDGNLWITEPKRDMVAKVTTSGVFTEY